MSNARPTPKQRRLVSERARGLCEYCLSPASFSCAHFEVEHILPSAEGGETDLANLALACGGCNSYKSDKTKAKDPKTGKLVNLFNPRRKKWSEHFAWEDDYQTIIGLTPIGRATVESLRLNRPELVNLRRALLLLGEHPPEIL